MTQLNVHLGERTKWTKISKIYYDVRHSNYIIRQSYLYLGFYPAQNELGSASLVYFANMRSSSRILSFLRNNFTRKPNYKLY